ncbi:MAG: hypothetical protein D6713_03955 [Deltaproteobacteria bacterium]|nr:MAG: hypothetical protein D6713_03955 [Deltaproteobacteria bacterium]
MFSLNLRKYFLLSSIPLLVWLSISFNTPDARGGDIPLPPPHAEAGCRDCHTPEFPDATKEKPRLLGGPVSACQACHGKDETSHHPVWVTPKGKGKKFFLWGEKQSVVCTTCHEIHQKVPAPGLLRGFPEGKYSVRLDLCIDCHGETFFEINPHSGKVEGESCLTCHESIPGEEDTATDVKVREKTIEVCDFCHNVKEKSHPENVASLERIPANLPRDSSGNVTCGTCHDPHGTAETLFFLRKRYIEHLEMSRYEYPHGLENARNCKGCHIDVETDKKKMRENLRFGGDTLRICLSCHGAMDSCHPVLMKPPPGMNEGAGLPLSKDGKIICTTCHDPMPDKGGGVLLRVAGREGNIHDLCRKCHEILELASLNPHSSMDDRGTCRFCHDILTETDNPELMKTSFISNPRLVCLRCHGKSNHPGGVSHLVTPSRPLPPEMETDARGRITCTTCHKPHIDTTGKEENPEIFVINAPSSSLCSACHEK